MKKINFLVLSREQAESIVVQRAINQPHILISINGTTGLDSTSAKIPTNGNRLDLLHLRFDDIDSRQMEILKENKEEKSLILFTEEHARNILNFVEKNLKDIDLIVVHCFAGICRSVAVASALSKIINNEDDRIFKSGVPNMLVYKTVLERFWLSDYGNIYPTMNNYSFENTDHYK
jgi:predicted protein tyrosine phosphatase